MVWLLPHIRAIAATVGAPITLAAKPRSGAAQLFAAEATCRDIIWLDWSTRWRRGVPDNLGAVSRLIADLRARRFDECYLLHTSKTLAFASRAAGIPVRRGYGARLQRVWLNRGPFLSAEQRKLDRFQQASILVSGAGVPMPEAAPRLTILDSSRQAILRYAGLQSGPYVALGIGASEPYKQWSPRYFARMISLLHDRGWRRFVLLGGAPDAPMARDIAAEIGWPDTKIIVSMGWPLTEVAAMLECAAFYVGNDTSFLNIAAAVGTCAFGLFGATPPFHHSPSIVPIQTPDRRISRRDGMQRITPDAVMRVIADHPHLVAA